MTARRSLVIGLASGVALMGVAGRVPAQSAGRIWRIGILPAGPMAPRKFQWDAFRERMHELGYVEGRNIQYEIRAPNKEDAPYDELAADLARLDVDVIVASGTSAVAAAKTATQRIAIVMCPAGDPVALGFVASLSRPGGNITGVTLQWEETTGKRLQLLCEMAPWTSRVAFIGHKDVKLQMEAAAAAARKLGVQLQSLEVGTADALPGLFATAIKGRADAVMVTQTTVTFGLRAQIAALALQHRLPSIYGLSTNAEAGGLMSYGPNATDYYRTAAVLVGKILKGAKPADMPVEQPTVFDLVINGKTAKALGLKIPNPILAQASRIIE